MSCAALPEMGKKKDKGPKGAELLQEDGLGGSTSGATPQTAMEKFTVVERGVPVKGLVAQLKKKSLAQQDWFDLSLFTVFMCLYLVIFSYQVSTETQYFMEASIKNALVEEDWSDVPLKTFYDINQISDWWSWFDDVVIDKVYDDWRMTSKGALASIGKMNMVIAGIEISQYRSSQESCNSEKYADTYHTACQSKSFQLGSTGIFHYSRIFDSYTQFFPIFNDKATALNQTKTLQNEKWIDASTRGATVTMFLYNPNLNFITFVNLECEMQTSGYFKKRARLNSIDIEPYVADATNTRFYLDFSFAVLVILRVLKTLFSFFFEWRAHKKFTAYFRSGWSYIDLILTAMFSGIIVWWFTFIGIVTVLDIPATHNDSASGGWDAAKSIEGPMESIRIFATYYMTLNACTVVLASIRFFGFFRYWGKLSVITSTLTSASSDLAHFIFFFFIIFGSYAYIGNLLFGRFLEEYSSLTQAIQTCFNLVLGDFDYDALRKVEPIMAPLFFWSICIVVSFTLINMFVAIISDMYAKVRGERDFQQSFPGQIFDSIIGWYYMVGDIFRRFSGKKRHHPSTSVLQKIAFDLESMGVEVAEEEDIIKATPSQYDGEVVARTLFKQFGVTTEVERSALYLRQTKNRAQQQLQYVNDLLTEIVEGR